MRRLTRTELFIEMLKLEAARAQNKEVSEYTAARVYIDFVFDELVSAIQSGLDRADAIHLVAVFAQVSREVASEILRKRLRSAGITEDSRGQTKSKAKAEPAAPAKQISAEAAPSTPAPVPMKEPVLAKPKVIEKPVPPAPVVPAAPAVAEDDKYAHLRRPLILGGGFLGEEERWMTEDEMAKEKERRAAIERSSIIGAEIAKKNKDS